MKKTMNFKQGRNTICYAKGVKINAKLRQMGNFATPNGNFQTPNEQ